MADVVQTNGSGSEQVNRVHFAVGFLVVAVGVYFSAFAVNLLLMR
jgi:hypothetical protein